MRPTTTVATATVDGIAQGPGGAASSSHWRRHRDFYLVSGQGWRPVRMSARTPGT